MSLARDYMIPTMEVAPSPSAPVVEVRGLSRRFDAKVAVENLDLTVAAGEFFAFLGPNGAGKSTTIKMMAGMLKPSAGTARILGIDVAADPLAVKRLIGVLPEDIQLYERLSPVETVRFVGSLYGLSRAESDRRAGELFELLELAEAERRRMVGDFSMGMKKKVALACALLHGPRLLFLDEPFNGIDAVTTRAIKRVFQSLVARGMTIFFSSHILEQVERLCSRIGIVDRGRLRALGTLAEVRMQVGAAESASLEDVFVMAVGGEKVVRGSLDFLG